MSNDNIFISTVFKGEAADNAELKSKDIVNAIEGFEETISIISKKIYGKNCSASCVLRPPQKGSFELIYVFYFTNIVTMLINPVHVEQLPNILATLHELFFKVQKNKVERIEKNSQGETNIYIENNHAPITLDNSINLSNIDSDILKETLNDEKLRESITTSHRAIERKSANKIVYKNNKNNQELSTITKENYKAFSPLIEKITEEEKEMDLWVKGLSFDGKKWDFEDKKTELHFSAPVEDVIFQKIILEGEAFKNGDSIIADVFVKYSNKKHKKDQYSITRVISHVIAQTQLTIK